MKSRTLNVDCDAFSSGQIGSKLWLCEQLELLFTHIDSVWIYGGWYGITAFLLKSRNRLNINEIRSLDVDPTCEPIADMINENWKWQNWQFKSVTIDCNSITPAGVDLVINTSTEHFETNQWFQNIPSGTVVALQGNNMPHDDHVVHSETLEDFSKQFPLSQSLYAGTKDFVYPDWKFTRFMVIGIK